MYTEEVNMSKHKTADQKLRGQPARNKAPTPLPDTNNPTSPPKGTTSNNQYR